MRLGLSKHGSISNTNEAHPSLLKKCHAGEANEEPGGVAGFEDGVHVAALPLPAEFRFPAGSIKFVGDAFEGPAGGAPGGHGSEGGLFFKVRD